MEVHAILCNHAEVQNNYLYVAGGGVDRVNIPQNQPPPWNVSLSIAINFMVPWTQTNQDHTIAVDLVDADGHPVMVPISPDHAQPLHAELRINVGRPPGLQIGDGQSVSAAIQLPFLPLEKLGMYTFVVSVDGSEEQRLAYRAVGIPAMVFGSGPTGLPSVG